MKIELHILQNFAPSNLNRDDTGAPKDCSFAGYRRARISSQCQKRAVREMYKDRNDIPTDDLGTRTKRLAVDVSKLLVEGGIDEAHSLELAGATINGALGKVTKRPDEPKPDDYKTQYLLFVPRRISKQLANLITEHQEGIEAYLNEREEQAAKKKGKAPKFPKDIGKAAGKLLEDARRTPDIALFGRMIADEPKWNVDASCQVAHAISTNRVEMGFDFYTAVDDFKPDDTAGADMMGTIQFNSSCFYRYAVLDIDSLKTNLDDERDDASLLEATVKGFVHAFVKAIPTGKQNSMAAHNLPSYVLAIVRDKGQPLSLTNAFAKPARPGDDADLIDDSISKLETYLGRVASELDDPSAKLFAWADRDPVAVDGLDIERVSRLDTLYNSTTSAGLS